MAGDLEVCRAQLRAGSKSFAAASRLLPARVRDDATVLYAFCREADDAVDVDQGGHAAVAQLRARLDRIYRGAPSELASDRALSKVVARHHLPRALLDALIEGLEWDAQGRRYESLHELQTYAARVAGTIGAMMALLMGVRTPDAVARACDLGVAMQLTNVARDVGEDARNGRLYLPAEWLREAGIDPQQWLARPLIEPGIRRVVRRLLDAADVLYARVDAGIAALPPACRPGINAARYVYADIGRMVKRDGCDSVSRRAVVSASRKTWLLLTAFLPLQASPWTGDGAPLAATAFLVDAVNPSPAPVALPADIDAGFPWWHLRTRALWLIDLFERLERRDRGALLADPSTTPCAGDPG